MTLIGKHALFGSLVFAAVLTLGGCGNKQDTTAQDANSGPDPAAANLAQPIDAQAPPPAQPAPQTTQAPVYTQPAPQSSDAQYGNQAAYDDSQDSEPPVEATEPPPPLPEYSQPECPGDNYIWTPGTWSYTAAGYYWVPGVWVAAPFAGALWTPPYWAYEGVHYRWHHGYWGRHIGFYGGINYGFGYIGRGYEGGYWDRDRFAYNRAVNNVNITVVHNVYNRVIVNNTGGNRISYVGGRGGINARPLPAELAVLREPRVPPVPAQQQHIREAAANREQFAAVNHGRPAIAAAARPLANSYREPARAPEPPRMQESRPAVAARPEARPETRNEPQNMMRPAQRPEVRQEVRQEPPARQESRPVQQERPAARQAPMQETRPLPRQESRPAPQQPRQENRPQPAARPVQEQPRPENHSQPAARAPQQPRPESHPAPQHQQPPHQEEKRPEEKKAEKK
jgi:hypothetical protein